MENHYHLKGSVPYFAITWLNLMNNVGNTRFLRCLQEFDEHKLSKEVKTLRLEHEPSYVEMHLQAALIRCFLFCRLKRIPFTVFDSFQMSLREAKISFDWPDDDQTVESEIEMVLDSFEKDGLCRVRFREFMHALLERLKTNRQISFKALQFWKTIPYIVAERHTVETEYLRKKCGEAVALRGLALIFLEKLTIVHIPHNLADSLIRPERLKRIVRQKEFENVNYYLTNPERIFEIRSELPVFISSLPVHSASYSGTEEERYRTVHDYVGSNLTKIRKEILKI